MNLTIQAEIQGDQDAKIRGFRSPQSCRAEAKGHRPKMRRLLDRGQPGAERTGQVPQDRHGGRRGDWFADERSVSRLCSRRKQARLIF